MNESINLSILNSISFLFRIDDEKNIERDRDIDQFSKSIEQLILLKQLVFYVIHDIFLLTEARPIPCGKIFCTCTKHLLSSLMSESLAGLTCGRVARDW